LDFFCGSSRKESQAATRVAPREGQWQYIAMNDAIQTNDWRNSDWFEKWENLARHERQG